jgi:hypothetical protein
MEEIKSVRVRNILEGPVTFQGIDLSGSQFDIKVTIYRDGKKRSLIGFNSNGNKVWDKIEFRDGGRYSNYTDDELILEYIETNSKLKNSNFGIIQDPWLEKPPKERSFGSDPYYLNNGAIIEIKWEQGGFRVFGKSWSDLDGNELNIERGQTQSSKGFINKTAKVLAPDSYEGENLNYTSLGLKSDSENTQPLVSLGTVSDKDIINQIISQWKSVIPNYDKLELCEPDNERCELIDFISPVDPLEESLPEEDNKLVSEDPIADDKISLTFQIDSNLSIKPREDFDFKLFIGEPPVDPGFNFGDEDDLSDLLLDDEFRETEFEGDVELIMKELDENFRNLIEESAEDDENNPSTGDSLPNPWFNYSSNAFGAPNKEKTYSSEYKSYIDSSKMPKPKMTKKLLIDVKLKVEGGLTGNPNDSAAKKGFCPTLLDGKRYHTNKGVTYAVWKSIFGSGNDKRFLKMSHDDWVKVFDSLYWNKHGKSSKYESVNALLVSYAWGGSKDATIRGAKKILGVNSLDMVSEAEAVAALISARAQLFINISQPGSKNNTFRSGWINATNAFVKAMYF